MANLPRRPKRSDEDSSGCLPGCLITLGFLLCLTGFGLILGIPLILAGYLQPFAEQAVQRKIRQVTDTPDEDDELGDDEPEGDVPATDPEPPGEDAR